MSEQVHPQIRSRKWISEAEYQLLATAPPNLWCRFWQRFLLGWRWEAVVVVIVPQKADEAAAIPERNGLLVK